MPFLDNVPFSDKYAFFGEMFSFWINMQFSDKSDYFGKICHFGINVHFLRNVPCLDKCAVFG